MTPAEIRTAVHEAMLPLLERIDTLGRGVEFQRRVIETLMQRRTDPTHLSILEISAVFGIAEKTARSRFAGQLEAIPGSKRRGVPVSKLELAWMSDRTARAAKAARRRDQKAVAP